MHVGGLEVYPVRFSRILFAPAPVPLVEEPRGLAVVAVAGVGKVLPVLSKHVDAALEIAQGSGVGVGGEDGGLIAGPVHVLGHRDGLFRHAVIPVEQAAHDAVVERGHVGRGGGPCPGGVAVDAFEQRTLSGQALEVRRGAAVVAVDAHEVGRPAVDDVEDDVGARGRAVRGQRWGAPQRDRAVPIGFSREGERDRLAGQPRQIDRALAPLVLIRVGLFEKAGGASIGRCFDAKVHRRVIAHHAEREVKPGGVGDANLVLDAAWRACVDGLAVNVSARLGACSNRRLSVLGLLGGQRYRENVDAHRLILGRLVGPKQDAELIPGLVPDA